LVFQKWPELDSNQRPPDNELVSEMGNLFAPGLTFRASPVMRAQDSPALLNLWLSGLAMLAQRR
jgi:hypothetical protein